MKKIVAIAIFFFSISCNKSIEESKEVFTQTLSRLPDNSPEDIMAVLSKQMLTEDYEALNMGEAYIHEIANGRYFVYEIPLGSQSNFNSFVLASVTDEGSFLKGIIVTIAPSLLDSSSFSGLIQYHSINRDATDEIEYENNEQISSAVYNRVLPDEMFNVTVTHCHSCGEPGPFLYFNLPEILGLGNGIPGNSGTFGSVWSGGGASPGGSSSGVGGAIPSGGSGTTVSGVRIVSALAEKVLFIKRRLGLNNEETNWLQQHFSMTFEIFNYFDSTTDSDADD